MFLCLPERASEETGELPRYLGRLASGYLLFDRQGDLIVMDPHAAHERVEYELLTAMHARRKTSQKLLASLGLPPTLGERALEEAERLKKLGFLLEEAGEGPKLSGIPDSFGKLHFSPIEGLRMALEVLEEMQEEDPEHPLESLGLQGLQACGETYGYSGSSGSPGTLEKAFFPALIPDHVLTEDLRCSATERIFWKGNFIDGKKRVDREKLSLYKSGSMEKKT